MKSKLMFSILSLSLLSTACLFHKKSAYTFPATFTKDQKEKTTVFCDKGKVLYDVNCAKCHNTVVKGKQVIPDFPANKLESYKLRFISPVHDSSMRRTNISMDELLFITTYLTYKKKNPTPKK